MKFLTPILVTLGLFGCTAGQANSVIDTVDDAHRTACDLLSAQQVPALEAEARRQGISVTDLINVFKTTCLLRMRGAEGEALAGIKMQPSGCAKVAASEAPAK